MKILVTGAAGFIGSHLIRSFLHAGHTVRALDNLSTGYYARVKEVAQDIEWIEGDIRNPDTLAKAVAGVEAVSHQAAIPSVARSVQDPVTSNEVNVGGTVLLLNACWKAGVRRVVFAGSSSAYGNSPSLPKVETMTPNPLSPYAVSKLSGEQYCQVFAGLGYVETVTFRYFNVFGPMQDPTSHYAAVIPKFATVIMDDEIVPLNGDGTQSRDFTYIDNVVQANTLGLTKEGVSGQVFNIGCGERYDLNYLIQALGEIIGKTPKVQNNPPRLGDVPHSLADIEKAKTLLGYQPSVTFYEGVKHTVEWLRLPESLNLFKK